MITSLQFTVHGLQFTMAGAAAIVNCKLKTENLLKIENRKPKTGATERSTA